MNICLVSANDVMEHFAYPGSIDFAADDQGAFSCIIHERLLYLFIVCESMFTIGEWRTISHANDTELQAQQWLQILAEEDSPLKLLWRTPIKIHRRAHRRRQPRSREGNVVKTATTKVFRGSDKILQLHFKRNQWREATPTAYASKSGETGSGNA